MAAYNTRVKIFIDSKANADADTVSGSYAKQLNDFIQTLDSSTGTIQQMNTVELQNGSIMTILVYLG